MLIPLVLVMLRLEAVVPRSVLILYPIVLIFLMAGSRFAYRIWKEHRLYSPLAALGEPVLVVGAGDAGARLTMELERSRQWRVVGLLDDDPAKQGRQLRNVVGAGADQRARALGRTTTACARRSSRCRRRNHAVRRRVAELCAAAGIEALTVPSYEDLISGRSALSAIRNVELDDLLGRDPIVLDNAGLAEWLGNRVVMVTGAGGSIGAELCRQIARFRPAKLVLFDISEAALYEIVTALADAFPQLPVVTRRRRRQARGAGRGGADAREARRDLPRGGLQARAADGGDERVVRRCATTPTAPGCSRAPPSRRRSRSSSSCRPTRRSTRHR